MNTWFYLFLIGLFISTLLVIKIFMMKREINRICKTMPKILNTDTNNTITIDSNDRTIKKLANTLNENLKKLRKLELEYKNGNRELKSSITDISHDLRTPLTAIRGYLDLMEDGKLSTEQGKYLKTIEDKVLELTDLTEQLFDFSKSLDIPQEVKKEMVCINDILEDTIASFYGIFKKYDIEPNVEICKKKVERLSNETMLKRIFENIISNAIKYSEKEFTVKMSSDGIIEFSNTSTELEHVDLEKIFDRYYTLRSAKKSNGIGLSIAKQLVDMCEGSIDAKIENGRLLISIKF